LIRFNQYYSIWLDKFKTDLLIWDHVLKKNTSIMIENDYVIN